MPADRVKALLATRSCEITQPSVQARAGEDRWSASAFENLRAVYASPWFWRLASVLPHNDLSVPKPGRPQDYPDWFMFLMTATAGIVGVASARAAVTMLSDRMLWGRFVEDVDRFVPDGWTSLSDIAHSAARHDSASRPRVDARAKRSMQVVPLVPRRPAAAAGIACLPPRVHHFMYFMQQYRGRKKVNGVWVPCEPGDPWHGVRQTVFAEFRAAGIEQAQAMGLLDPRLPFAFKDPDRHQYVGSDGVVFPKSRKCRSTACGDHMTGTGEQVHGPKFTILSIRLNAQYGSRIILDIAHTGSDPASRYKDEGSATVDMALMLSALAKGGMKGIIVDSVVRGRMVEQLQRAGVTVVNYPHARRNPKATRGKRMAEGREEKGQLRTVAIHHDECGVACEHGIYFLGGVPVERLIASDGRPTVRDLAIVDYDQRWSKRDSKGTRREYLTVQVPCTLSGVFTVRVPLFHTDPTSQDPDANWGEFVRVFAPGSPQFKFLYGARNDTESRHTNLKAAVKFLPADVAGQEIRLLGAAIAMNALAWQFQLQAIGERNVFDNTA